MESLGTYILAGYSFSLPLPFVPDLVTAAYPDVKLIGYWVSDFGREQISIRTFIYTFLFSVRVFTYNGVLKMDAFKISSSILMTLLLGTLTQICFLFPLLFLQLWCSKVGGKNLGQRDGNVVLLLWYCLPSSVIVASFSWDDRVIT